MHSPNDTRDSAAYPELAEVTGRGGSAPVALLRIEDEAEAAGVLARAFRDNPGMVALLDPGDTAWRQRMLGRLMPILVGAYRVHGQAWVTRDGGRIAGVALVAPPAPIRPPCGCRRASPAKSLGECP